MQFTIFIAALLAASPALAGDLTFFAGADCTGPVVGVATNVPVEECIFVANGGSAKSISYSGVPDGIEFFNSGGGNDECTNGPSLTLGGGSGCATAAAGHNFESTFFF
ncbi:hypothetical protein C8R46DRAFT_1226622 [Mycena filopes]|nr:hypothetical protein C8R46DRAFT_1226622 [Mycena filopes]